MMTKGGKNVSLVVAGVVVAALVAGCAGGLWALIFHKEDDFAQKGLGIANGMVPAVHDGRGGGGVGGALVRSPGPPPLLPVLLHSLRLM